MSAVKSGNGNHDNQVAKAEGVRQVAAAAAGPSQPTVIVGEAAFYGSCIASALSNGVNPQQFHTALRELGRWGV